ncbi:MAG: hypothetical protein ACREXY_12135 [Gammaproteobacteria bacterium]
MRDFAICAALQSVLCGTAIASGVAIPEDVATLTKRIVDCTHWFGEEPYNIERRSEIEAAIQSLRCDALSQDEVTLLRKHEGDRRIADAVAEAKEKTW